MNTEEIIHEVIEIEGGFVNDPDDRGGATNMGITQKTLSDFLDREASIEDVKRLDKDVAFLIYYKEYVRKPRFDWIVHPHVRAFTIDFGIHSGQQRATKALQRAAGTKPDGLFGQQTAKAVNDANANKLMIKLFIARLKFLVILCVKKPRQLKFLRGWINRICGYLEEAFDVC